MSVVSESRHRQDKMVRMFEIQAKQAPGVPVGEIAASGVPSSNLLGGTRDRMRKEAYLWNTNWVYSCVHYIAQRVAAAEILAGELIGAPENEPRSSGFWRKSANLPPRRFFDTMGSRMRQKAAVDENLELFATHPVMDVLCRPNPVQKKFEFLYFSAANLELTGEAYWIGGVVNVDGEDRVEVWAVPTKWITPIHEGKLFTGYRFQSTTMTEPITLPPENVARAYFADPADPKSVLSPLRSIMPAVRTDNAMQRSQQIMMERGISPNVIVELGDLIQGPDNIRRKPRLSKGRRRQIIRSVRELWSQSLNAGDPIILDDFIKAVHKLQMTAQEMDFLASGKVTKERICQAYRVNPISLGQDQNANRAQAVMAQKITADNAVNPVIDIFSETATDFLGPMYEEPKRLVVWFERWEPKDPDLDLKRWDIALKHNAALHDEFRTNLLGLPPLEQTVQSNLFTSGPGLTFATQMITQMNANGLDKDFVQKLFVQAGMDPKAAEDLFDFEVEEPPPPPALPPPPDQEEAIDEEEAPDLPEQRQPFFDTKGVADLLKKPRPAKSPMSRKDLQQIHVKQVSKTEKAIAAHIADHFRRVVSDTARRIRGLDTTTLPEKPKDRADMIMRQVFDLDDARDDLLETAVQVMPAVFAHGAESELKIHRNLLDDTKQTTAQQLAAELELDEQTLPFSLGPLPEWVLEAAREELEVTFQEGYWQTVGETTRDDIARSVEQGVEEGFSMRRLARQISENHGAAYSFRRAMLVARTETPNLLNAGHAATMRQLEVESGLRIGKVWVSAFQTFSRDSHVANDGQITDGADAMFELNGNQIPWPAHHSLPAGDRCNCFPAGTLVQGAYTGAQRAWYDGIFTEIITRSGRRLTVTPNHPVVTAKGLIAACEIRPGDQVMTYCPERDSTLLARSTRDQINHKPALVEDVCEAFFSETRTSRSARIVEIRRTHMDDFYGDGKSINGDIDVVRTDWRLADNRKFSKFEKCGNTIFSLEDAELFSVPSDSSPSLGFMGVSSSATGVLCSQRRAESPRVVFGHVGPAGELRIGIGANLDASLLKSSQQEGAGIPSFLGECKQRFAGTILLDDVAQIRNFYSAGHVYDLQSRYGLVVASDNVPTSGEPCSGIVTSNCLCTHISEIIQDQLT